MLKKLFIALLSLGTIAVVVWLVLPEYRGLGEAKVARTQAEEALQEKQLLVSKIKNLEAQYREVEDVASKVAQIFPPMPDIPNLLVEIPEIASQNGMTLDDISFNVSETALDATTRSKTQGSLPYQTMQASISVTGSYEALDGFLKALEKELRIIDVWALQFSVPSGEGSQLFTFNLSVRMYYGLQT
ncbi:MAG: type 4a pilus biogenesis protein PilO [bacterium]|nr:type 4a pilus biogenesis protein PilO [bacterium]